MIKKSVNDVLRLISRVAYRIFVGKRLLTYKNTQKSFRYLFMNFMFFMGVAVFFGTGAILLNTAHQLAFPLLALAGISLLSILLLRYPPPLQVPGYFFMVPFGIFCAALVHIGSAQGFGIICALVFPAISIFVLGIRYGIYFDIIMGVILSIIILNPELSQHHYALNEIGIFFSVYVFLGFITLTSELIRVGKEDEVTQLNKELQQERNELTAMKDNLNVGIFSLDRDFIIQPYYSQALEDILSHSALTGLNILEIFADSITGKQRNTLKDYFTMMFNGTHNMKLLEEINPINEVEYVSPETRAKRTLSCKFSCIRRREDTLLLGVIYDITEQVKTEAQLKEEESKRQTEMQTLFEIVQIEPAVFHEFIEDTDYQFARLNSTLKRQDFPLHQIIISFYQTIHAIKSNAAILGLEVFAAKCHTLEDEIKQIQDKAEATFVDLMHLTLELDKVFMERDKLKQTLEKITSFRKQYFTESIFIISVRKAIERIAEETGKLAILNAENVDDDIIKSDLRNILKEIVLQLARNAVYHGIEDPETRLSYHKAEYGTISLSIQKRDNTIEIVFSDDGRGIALSSVKEKAVQENLLPPEENNQDQILSVLFMPGFSTSIEENLNAGRGIGLSLVADRLKEINGNISITAKEGTGTAFTMHIPYESSK